MRATTCQHCHATTANPTAAAWHRLNLRNRGGKPAYLCPTCARKMMGYGDKNTITHGKCKANGGHSASFELETVAPTLSARVELMQDVSHGGGFIPTSDCTVDVEFKSPIYYSLNPVMAKLPAIEWLQDNEQLFIDEACGTHLHIGLYNSNGEANTSWVTGYVTRNYRALFEPLANTLYNAPAAAAAVFGRELGGWAAYPDFDYPRTHQNFINVQHTATLEFRLCKFINAKQYANCIRFCDHIVKLIESAMTYQYTGVERHKAELAGRKIAKLFAKYYQNTLEF